MAQTPFSSYKFDAHLCVPCGILCQVYSSNTSTVLPSICHLSPQPNHSLWLTPTRVWGSSWHRAVLTKRKACYNELNNPRKTTTVSKSTTIWKQNMKGVSVLRTRINCRRLSSGFLEVPPWQETSGSNAKCFLPCLLPFTPGWPLITDGIPGRCYAV